MSQKSSTLISTRVNAALAHQHLADNLEVMPISMNAGPDLHLVFGERFKSLFDSCTNGRGSLVHDFANSLARLLDDSSRCFVKSSTELGLCASASISQLGSIFFKAGIKIFFRPFICNLFGKRFIWNCKSR
jgi:hypothetical protein